MSEAQRGSRWLTLGLMAVTAAACLWQWTLPLDRALHDLAQRSRPASDSDEVVVVAIDDASIDAVGRWPWRHGVHAQALRQLAQAKPRAVLLDLLLAEADPDPAQDAQLADAMQALGKVVLPAGLLPRATRTEPWLKPAQPLVAHAVLAHSDAAPDADGRVRHAALWAGSEANQLPHPALALLDLGGTWPDTVPRQAPRPSTDEAAGDGMDSLSGWRRTGLVSPDLSRTGRPRTVSFSALLRGEVPERWLHDRYVVIGVTAQGMGTRLSTALTPREGMPGAELIARVTQALAHGWLIQTLPSTWNAALSAAWVGALLWAMRRLTPGRALLACAAVASGALAVSWALLVWCGTWWPPFALVTAVLLCYPLWSWRRLQATARALEHELQTLAAEPGLGPVTQPGERGTVDFMRQRTDAIHEANAQLRQARALLAHTLAVLPDAVWVLDTQGRITQANQQACALMQTPAATAMGRTLDEALAGWTPADAPQWSMLLQQAGQERRPLSTEATHASGGQRLVSLLSTEQGHIVCATDVTALRQAELQRTELLGFIAHDIRSPQASLISLVELHRIGGNLPLEETLTHVEAMARQTLALCEELLQVMRAETRALTLGDGDLVALAEGAMSEVQLQARAKDIALVGDWASGTRQSARFDDYLLHRALVNLLSNAIKFSPRGAQVKVGLRRQADAHVLSVQDQGPGIPESELGRLFKRYERVEQGRPSRLAAGIGLGLVFIDTVARRHGGRVHVINQPGVGACFELWLPVQALGAATTPAAA